MEFLDWKSIGSLLATLMFLRTAIRDFLPPEIHQILTRFYLKLFASVQSNISIIIEEFDSSYNNELFDSVQTYLTSQCFSSAKILRLSKPQNCKNLTFTMDTNQKVEDTFDGFKLKWSLRTIEKKPNTVGYGFIRGQESRHFQLTFHKKYKDKVHSLYIPHVIEEADKIKFKNRQQRLYTNRSADDNGRFWSSVPFSHPSTFDTVAIDPVLKEEIKGDLVKFVNRREFYSRVGRAWKRGYLLYGPPGTGKTSLIAAIANFLEFDIYDLELTAVTNNSQLRKLLIATSSKSVIVVEDVDCTLDLSDRKKQLTRKKKEREGEGEESGEKKENEIKNNGASPFSTVSLSGVLNFVDGLWSSCGGERVMIFTTNHIEKLDPALLRPGRMDKHINLSYCEFKAFKVLMKNYLYIEEHKLEEEVEGFLPLVKITPADVAEVFMSCNDDVDVGMKNLVEELKKRLASASESKKEIEETERKTQDEKLKDEAKEEVQSS
ncbi:AAA-ATPase At3g50940-like [Tasmannia lanceolata]|uniref:AAA-ATPase At3g50940-like n=1 Tax=Tasmannia lanceolata TaxID=3420 RepID=UPI004064A083